MINRGSSVPTFRWRPIRQSNNRSSGERNTYRSDQIGRLPIISFGSTERSEDYQHLGTPLIIYTLLSIIQTGTNNFVLLDCALLSSFITIPIHNFVSFILFSSALTRYFQYLLQSNNVYCSVMILYWFIKLVITHSIFCCCLYKHIQCCD